jgi:hypothetical protein
MEWGTRGDVIQVPRMRTQLVAARTVAQTLAEIEEVSDPADPGQAVYESGALLPGPGAILAGPTFEEWLDAGA